MEPPFLSQVATLPDPKGWASSGYTGWPKAPSWLTECEETKQAPGKTTMAFPGGQRRSPAVQQPQLLEKLLVGF